MNYIFWIFWTIEVVLAIWWVGTNLKQKHMPTNPYAPIAFFYLGVALLVRFVIGAERVSMGMILIPAIPLTGLLLIITIFYFHKGRWN